MPVGVIDDIPEAVERNKQKQISDSKLKTDDCYDAVICFPQPLFHNL